MRLVCLLLILCLIAPMLVLAQGTSNDDRIYDAVRRKLADDADVKAVQAAMFDPFEYLALRDRDGLLKRDFTQPLGKVSYHVPCHARVQNIGQKTREMLESIPETTVSTVERCTGHDGTPASASRSSISLIGLVGVVAIVFVF